MNTIRTIIRRYLDVETVPGEVSGAVLDYRRSRIKTGNAKEKKDEVLQRKAEALRNSDAVDVDYAQIIVIGVAEYAEICAEDVQYELAFKQFYGTDERVLLNQFVDYCENPPAFEYITFNGIQFDLPLIKRRCAKCKAKPIHLHVQKENDVMLLFTPYWRATPKSQRELCLHYGIPVNDNTSGADVQRFFEAGEWDKILHHNKADLAQLHGLYDLADKYHF